MSSQISLRDYTMPAIEQRIQELLKRRITVDGTLDGIHTERITEKLVC